MRRSNFAVTVSAAALCAAVLLAGAGQASAQTDLRIGSSVQGVLEGADAVGGDSEMGEYRYDAYRFSARAGQRFEAVMRSDAFDSYLAVFSQGASEAFATDDDGLGEGVNARLRFVAPENGDYILHARTLSGLDGGSYSLSLNERPAAPRAPRPTAISLGREIAGALSDRDPEADNELGFYDAYAFRAREGQRVAISLKSDDFDPYVRVGRLERGAFISLADNDDSPAGGLDSYLVFTAPSSGEFVIQALALGGDGSGDYTVGLSEGPQPLPAAPIALGGSADGRLNADSRVNDGGVRADAYRFTGSAGQRIDATLNSDAFDAYLELFDASGQRLAQDDDGGDEGTNSRILFTLPSAGEYTLQARAYSGNGEGGYTLALREAVPPPAPTPLAVGETLRGEITADGPRDDQGRGLVDYVFSGTQGNRIQAIMRSGDFDTYLQIGNAADTFEALSQDDDGLGEGTDSRLNFILPASGAYVIRATPYGGDAKGLFSIELLDKGPQPQPGSILIGATARGTLSDADAITDDGVSFDAYRIRVAEGDKLEVTMTSNDFDAYLDIGRDGDNWTSIASDDDSLSDTHAKIDWNVEDAGVYVIRARSFDQGQTGAYALTVSRKP